MSSGDKAIKLLSLEGKVAVITGGASGIGLGAAMRMAEMGAIVTLLDIDKSKGLQAADDIYGRGGQAKFYECDVTSSVDCKRTVESIIGEFGRIDVLFNLSLIHI